MEMVAEQLEGESPRTRRRGGVRLLFWVLLVMMLVTIAVAGVRYRAQERIFQEDLSHRHALDDQRQRQIARLLVAARADLENGEYTTAERRMKQAKVLDIEGAFSQQFVVLVQAQHELEDEGAAEEVAAQKESLMLQWKAALDKKQFIASEKLLMKLKELDVPAADLAMMLAALDAAKLKEDEEQKEREAAEKQRKRAITSWVKKLESADNGKYDAAAMDMLEQALKEFPAEPQLLQLSKKWADYHQTVRVPGDYASIDEALPRLRSGDTLQLGQGVFYAVAVIEVPLIIKGVGIGKTVIEGSLKEGACLRFTTDAAGSQLSELTLRGVGYRQEPQRHGLLLVEGDLAVNQVEITRAAGHGVAVISGKLELSSSVVHANGWDGVSILGEKAEAAIKDCRIFENMHHGVDFWKGAIGTVFRCEIVGNMKCGVLVTGGKTRVALGRVYTKLNRESGVVIDLGARVSLANIVSSNNEQSGIVVQGEGTYVDADAIMSSGNLEYGYLLSTQSRYVEKTSGSGQNGRNNGRGLLMRKVL